jgi:hypothetical protein
VVLYTYLTETFKIYLPWFDLLWISTIILNLLVLRKGAWQTGTCIFSILVSILNIAIAISLMGNISLVYTLQGALGYLGEIDYTIPHYQNIEIEGNNPNLYGKELAPFPKIQVVKEFINGCIWYI